MLPTFTVNVANIHLHSHEFSLYSHDRGHLEVSDGSGLLRRAPLTVRMLQIQQWGPWCYIFYVTPHTATVASDGFIGAFDTVCTVWRPVHRVLCVLRCDRSVA